MTSKFYAALPCFSVSPSRMVLTFAVVAICCVGIGYATAADNVLLSEDWESYAVGTIPHEVTPGDGGPYPWYTGWDESNGSHPPTEWEPVPEITVAADSSTGGSGANAHVLDFDNFNETRDDALSPGMQIARRYVTNASDPDSGFSQNGSLDFSMKLRFNDTENPYQDYFLYIGDGANVYTPHPILPGGSEVGRLWGQYAAAAIRLAPSNSSGDSEPDAITIWADQGSISRSGENPFTYPTYTTLVETVEEDTWYQMDIHFDVLLDTGGDIGYETRWDLTLTNLETNEEAGYLEDLILSGGRFYDNTWPDGGRASEIDGMTLKQSSGTAAPYWPFDVSLDDILVTTPGAVVPGDFDDDGDVDGADFLLWQRDTSVGNLAVWQANFGPGPSAGAMIAAVPEPGSVLLLFAGLMALAYRHRDHS